MKSAVVLAWLAFLAGALSLFAAEKKVPRYEGKPLNYWVKRLQTAENEKERKEAGQVLIAFGPAAVPAVPALVEMLDDYSEDFRQEAAGILGKIGPGAKAAVPGLISTFKKSKEGNTRKAVLEALGKIEPPPDQVMPILIQALADEWWSARQVAADHLRKIGPPAKAAVPQLQKLVAKDEPFDRAVAARALWSIERNPKVIPVLATFLDYEDKNGHVVFYFPEIEQAVLGLGEVGPYAKNTLPQLRKTLGYDHRFIREAAIEAIRKIDPEEGRKLKLNEDGTVTMEGVGKIAVRVPLSFQPTTPSGKPGTTVPASGLNGRLPGKR